VFVPSVVLGELYYAAKNSSQIAENIARVEQFRLSNTILSCDAITANHYGEVKTELKLAGRPIPKNDIWIAAIAKQYALTIVSRDKHFDYVTASTNEVW
jgi:tRNA(fMet)-specific endonuclease VapC